MPSDNQAGARKQAVRAALFRCAAKAGFNSAYALADRLLSSRKYNDDFDFVSVLHGEICECVLELKLSEIVRKNPGVAGGWFYNKSLVLKDRFNPSSNFYTEIDLVLFTAACIYLFECKSYSGEKRLVGNGVLKRTMKHSYGNQVDGCDVYRQSKLHLDAITPWVEEFTLPGKVPVVQMCIFNFSLGPLSDERTAASKLELPCLDEGTVADFILSHTEPVWDLKTLRVVSEKLGVFSGKVHDRHLEYVKGLHGKEQG